MSYIFELCFEDQMSNNSYNKWGWIVLLGTVFVSLVWVLYFMLIFEPVDLGEESDVIPVIAGLSANISAVEDYWVSSDLMIQKGAEVYSMYCALCHGAQGRGDGVAGRGLKPPPRDFSAGQWKFGGTSINIFEVITKGSEGTSMASFSHIPKKERWALVHFVRSLSKNPVPDDLNKIQEFATDAN